MDEVEKSALAALEQCAEYDKLRDLGIRYQQRKAVCDFIRSYVRNQQRDKDFVMSELNREEDEQYGNHTDDTP